MSRSLTIEKGNTRITLKDYDSETLSLLKRFIARNLSKWSKVPGDTWGSVKMEVSHRFATFSPDKKELRMARGLYDELKSYLITLGLEERYISEVQIPEIVPIETEYPWKDGKVVSPRNEIQEKYCDFMVREDKPLVVNNAATGWGKASPLDTPILTPTGFRRIGDLVVGDLVIAWDGSVTKVTGVYPQGYKDVYKLTTEDGRCSRSCLEHLWKYRCKDGWLVDNTSSIINRLKDKEDFCRLPAFKGNEQDKKVLANEIDQYYAVHSFSDGYYLPTLYEAKGLQKRAWACGLKCRVYNTLYGYQLVINWESEELEITNMEYDGYKECVCIQIEHQDHLYVCDDYIVTHNTYMALYTMYQLKHRTIITVLPRYTSVWVAAIAKFFSFTSNDIYDVSREDIDIFLDKLKTGEINPKVIIFPLTRIDTYLKRWRAYPEQTLHLDSVFEIMGGGIRLIDEAHESIYSIYMSTLYGNFKKNIGLSATLRGDDDFINKIYQVTFPNEAYLMPPVYEKYIDVIALRHRMRMDKYRINVKGFGGYSHVKLEQAILKNKTIFENYYQTCKYAFEEFYLKDYLEGQKFVWFFATIAMCNEMRKRFLHDYPDLDLFVFTGDVSKKKGMQLEYLNHTGLITTPTSFSTGKDVPKLFTVFACVAISSSQRNDQMNGRARPVDEWWPGLNPKFVYWVCPDIPKQVEYHHKKKQVLAKKTKTFQIHETGLWV